MISRLLKEKAFELRRLGKSYDLISKETGVSSGMLSYWFSKLDWSKNISAQNIEDNLKKSKEKIILMNKQRSLKLMEKYDLTRDEARLEFGKFKKNPLFIGALMLYLGEGDKSSKGHALRMGNIDYSVLKIFIKFTVKFCNVDMSNVKFWLLGYPDLDIKMCENWWIEKLGLTEQNMYKTQIIKGQHKSKRLRFGVGNIIIPNKALKIKVLEWIELMSEELMRV